MLILQRLSHSEHAGADDEPVAMEESEDPGNNASVDGCRTDGHFSVSAYSGVFA